MAKSERLFIFGLLFILGFVNGNEIVFEDNGYSNVVVSISPDVSPENGQSIIDGIKVVESYGLGIHGFLKLLDIFRNGSRQEADSYFFLQIGWHTLKMSPFCYPKAGTILKMWKPATILHMK